MSTAEWTQKKGTLSHKNAIKEFGLSENDIIQAMKSGKLQYRQNYAHGNPYYKFLRSEVKALAQELHGANKVEDQALKHQLNEINKQINSLKRKLKSLEREKAGLIKMEE
jgi:hypothetical protein